jgi:hypothetical protein
VLNGVCSRRRAWLILASIPWLLWLPSIVSPQSQQETLMRWNAAVLRAVSGTKYMPPMASRALAIVHTCTYDAWSAYDEKALGTQLGGALRRPASERTEANKEKAISYAAYRALTDLFPSDAETVYKPLMRKLGYDPNDNSTDIETPAGIGNVACAAVLEYRHHDGANQLGDFEPYSEKSQLAQSGMAVLASRAASESGPYIGQNNIKQNKGERHGAPYEDWSGYRAVNALGTVPARATFTKPLNPDRWQPLTYTDSNGNLVVQMFEAAQWGFVKPFALASGDELRAVPGPGPAKYGSPEYATQAEELISLSANLSDRQKMLAEYWTDGGAPAAERWMRFAEFVCERDHATLDDEVKLFFALSNAMMDADIAAWDAKRFDDSARPATTVPLLYRDKKIRAWGCPGKGTMEMDGGQWTPYQAATLPTPASPEYISETSTESAAAARVLALWTGSDRFGYSVTIAKGSSKIEPGATPAAEIVLKWGTFSEAADEAGMAGRCAGVHFARGDLAGRKLGWAVAERARGRAQEYFGGSVNAK